MNVVSDQGAYLVVGGDDGVDVWTDDWYLDTPPAGWVAPTYAVPYQFVRRNTSESSGGNYTSYVDLTKNGLPITEAEFTSLTVINGSGLDVTPALGSSFYNANHVSIDCQIGPCSSSDYVMTGAYASFNLMPLDDYAIIANMADGSIVSAMVTHDEDISLPYVSNLSMLSAWSGSELDLSWTNRTGVANWDRVTQIRLSIIDSTGADVGIVKLNPTATSMTLTDAMIQDMYAKGDGTIASWRVQARAYVSGVTSNPQIARSYSNPVALPTMPVPVPILDFTEAILDGISSIYIQYPTEVGQPGHPGTVREVIELSGSTGTYNGKATQSFFDGSGSFVQSEPAELFDAILNPDGTLTAAGTVTFTLNVNNSSYLIVTGDDGFDVWTDDWYLNTPPAGWVTPTYEVSYQMLSLNTFESGSPYYQAFVALTKNGLPISFAEYLNLTVIDDLGNNEVPSSGPFFWSGNSVSVDCLTGSCSWSDYAETAALVRFSALPSPDNYTVTVNMTDGSNVGAYISHDEDLVLPVVASGTMLSAWSGSDINLSWTNPTASGTWNRVTQLRLYIRDGNNTTVGTVKLNPTDSTMTLTNAMLQDMYAIGDGTVASWRVQARTYVSGVTTNPQIARSYSNWVNLP